MCELAELGGCRGSDERHHIIQRGKGRGSPDAVKKALNHYRLIAFLCHYHHQKYGQSRWLREELIRRRSIIFGKEAMRRIINSIPWETPQPELTYEGIMGDESG